MSPLAFGFDYNAAASDALAASAIKRQCAGQIPAKAHCRSV